MARGRGCRRRIQLHARCARDDSPCDSRSSRPSAASTSRGRAARLRRDAQPHPQHAVDELQARRCSGRTSTAAAAFVALDDVRRLGQQPLDALGGPRLARSAGSGDLVMCTRRTCGLLAPSRQRFDRDVIARPGGSCGVERGQQLVGRCSSLDSSNSMTSSQSVDADRQRRGKAHPRAWDESLRSCASGSPARRNSRSNVRTRSRWLISRRSPPCESECVRVVEPSDVSRVTAVADGLVNVRRQYSDTSLSRQLRQDLLQFLLQVTVDVAGVLHASCALGATAWHCSIVTLRRPS